MLVQRSHLKVPGLAAFTRQVIIRGGDLVVQILTSSGLATDWGVQADFVSYISRQTRSQLSILLEGRGYFELAQGPVDLTPGDVVHSDQGLHADEGYAGSPCTVMILEWGHSSFALPWQGQACRSRIARTDVLALNRLVARIDVTPPLEWVRELYSRLHALGLSQATQPGSPDLSSRHSTALYAALGEQRSQLARHPSLLEVANRLGVSERQARRAFRDLAWELSLTSTGWRDFVSDARMGWAQQLLSIPQLRLADVAQLAGFRSSAALSHAFTMRGPTSPGTIARRLTQAWT